MEFIFSTTIHKYAGIDAVNGKGFTLSHYVYPLQGQNL